MKNLVRLVYSLNRLDLTSSALFLNWKKYTPECILSILRRGKEPLKQCVARLAEAGSLGSKAENQSAEFCLKPPGNVYISLKTTPPYPVELYYKTEDKVEVIKYLTTSNLFDRPMPSKEIYNFVLQEWGTKFALKKSELNNLGLIRALKLTSDNMTVVKALLH